MIVDHVYAAIFTSEYRYVERNSKPMIPAQEALERLREGNRRFVADIRSDDLLPDRSRLSELAKKQQPFAIVLGCSDSRVPVEFVFDQGFGDLFVIRVAGNVVAPSQLCSVEFAAERFGTRLVVVLGHSQCGAIQTTFEELQQPPEDQARHMRPLVERIRPSVEGLSSTELHLAVRANVEVSVKNLRHGSEVLEKLIHNEGLLVVGAAYLLETGVIEFFDGVEAG